MSMNEFVGNLRKAKVYAALDEIMGGKKHSEAKKAVYLYNSDLKLLDINHGLSYVVNPNKKYTPPKKRFNLTKYKHENLITEEDMQDPRVLKRIDKARKIMNGDIPQGIDVNEITLESVKNSFK